MRLDVEVTDTATGLLAGVAGRLEDPRPALAALADDFHARERRVFATGGFGAWAPLAAATQRRKGGGRVLVDTGGLLRSLTTSGDRYAVEKIAADRLLVGTRHPAAAIHRRSARGMPERDPAPPSTAAERDRYARTLLAFVLGDGPGTR